MRKDFKQIGYTISLFFLGLLAWNPWIGLPNDGVIDTLDYELRLLFILVILLMLPRALETVDYNKAAKKLEQKDEKDSEEEVYVVVKKWNFPKVYRVPYAVESGRQEK